MNVVAHMTKITDNGITASARIAKFLHERLKACGKQSTLVHTPDTCNSVTDSVDTLFIVNGPMAFSDILFELSVLVRKSRRIIWVQNDVIIKPPKTSPNNAESPFRKAFAEYGKPLSYWTSVPSMINTPCCRYLDFQRLSYSEPLEYKPTEKGIVYYGAFRNDRISSFNRYLNTHLYPVNISSTVARKFKEIAPLALFHSKFNNPLCLDLSKFEASLYLQDELSNKEFCSIGNRFYETLSSGIPLLIDHLTLKTFELSGIQVDPLWIVKSQFDIPSKLAIADKIAADQKEAWNKDYKQLLTEDVDKYIGEIYEME